MSITAYPKLQPRVIKKIRELNINKKRKRGKRDSKMNVRMIKNKSVNTHNLIQLTPARGDIKNGTKGRNYSASIKFGLINTRGLKSEENLLKGEIVAKNLEIIAITETWLNNTNKENAWCKTSELNRDDLNIDIINREGRGGGIAIVWRNTITVTRCKHGILNTFEYGIWKLISGISSFQNRNTISHPPNKGTLNEFINERCELLDSLDSSEILWMGDFNIQVNQCTNTDTEQFVQTIEAMSIEQLVSFSTHDLGNTLDIILKEKHTSYEIANIKPGHFISDH